MNNDKAPNRKDRMNADQMTTVTGIPCCTCAPRDNKCLEIKSQVQNKCVATGILSTETDSTRG